MKSLILIASLLFSGLAMAASPVGTWKLNDQSNTHISKLDEQQQLIAMMVAAVITELKFYNNGKVQVIGTNAQGTWKKEKVGYSWFKTDKNGKKQSTKLLMTKEGKLKVTIEEGIYFLYDRKVVIRNDRHPSPIFKESENKQLADKIREKRLAEWHKKNQQAQKNIKKPSVKKLTNEQIRAMRLAEWNKKQ